MLIMSKLSKKVCSTLYRVLNTAVSFIIKHLSGLTIACLGVKSSLDNCIGHSLHFTVPMYDIGLSLTTIQWLTFMLK